MSHNLISEPTADAIAAAARALLRGRLIGLPTETVYGLAARGDHTDAVNSIFAAKGRPRHNPLILHVGTTDDARSLLADDLDERLKNRLERLQSFWPGPLTLIGPKHASILDEVTAGGPTVAIRIPDHPVALAVLKEMKRQNGSAVPLAAPSANVSNYVSPTTAEHVATGLGELVEMVLDGGRCRVGLESTIVFLGTADTPPCVLRSGRLSEHDLAARLGESVAIGALGEQAAAPETRRIAAPGQFAKHYSPHTESVLLPIGTPPNPREGVLRIDFAATTNLETTTSHSISHWTFAADGHLETAASNLYDVLRQADVAGFQRIEIVACPDQGIGVAIMDRLRRATSST